MRQTKRRTHRLYPFFRQPGRNPCSSGNMSAQATYALWGNKQGNDCTLFLGNGTLLSTPNIIIKSATPANVLLEYKNGTWHYTASADCTVSLNKKTYRLKAVSKATELK